VAALQDSYGSRPYLALPLRATTRPARLWRMPAAGQLLATTRRHADDIVDDALRPPVAEGGSHSDHMGNNGTRPSTVARAALDALARHGRWTH